MTKTNFEYADEDDDLDIVAPHPPDETWLTSYGDLMTILLVFFVLLISASQISSIEFERIKKAFKAPEPQEQTLSKIYDALVAEVEIKDLSDVVKIEEDDKSIALTLPGQMLFESGKSELREDTLGVLTSIASVLENLPVFARVAIEGHTDDNPVHTAEVTSNWSLSAMRALAVLEHLDVKGGCQGKCELRGYGEYRPSMSNRDEEGVAITEHQAANRRVVIRIY